jgi:hypothetical protein
MCRIYFVFILVTLFACQNTSKPRITDVDTTLSNPFESTLVRATNPTSNGLGSLKYYDTTGRLVFVIEWGGVDSIRRMLSPQIADTGANSYLAGMYFYREYLNPIFGYENNFSRYLEPFIEGQSAEAFRVTDSIIHRNYGFELRKAEFDCLLRFLRLK